MVQLRSLQLIKFVYTLHSFIKLRLWVIDGNTILIMITGIQALEIVNFFPPKKFATMNMENNYGQFILNSDISHTDYCHSYLIYNPIWSDLNMQDRLRCQAMKVLESGTNFFLSFISFFLSIYDSFTRSWIFFLLLLFV